MKIIVIDISGKVPIYDISLCEAIQRKLKDEDSIKFLCPKFDASPKNIAQGLINLVPRKYKNTEKLWKRLLKFLELSINYIILTRIIMKDKPDVVHFQWFPLLEFSSLEVFIVRVLRTLSPKSKFILTIHNVYPHNISGKMKRNYSKRFRRITSLLDSCIVHTKKTKMDVINEFGLTEDKIKVVHHGIFTPQNFIPSHNEIKNNMLSFILYGNQSQYKGTDVFVDAVKLLPLNYRDKFSAVIAGEIHDKKLSNKLQKECADLNIELLPFFLPEEELYRRIDASNVIVLPYRAISQSGVLLLALFFNRYIITSDLPSFKETLHGFTEDMFFESENPQSLANLIIRYMDGHVDLERQRTAIDNLNNIYSWGKAADKSIIIYRDLIDKQF